MAKRRYLNYEDVVNWLSNCNYKIYTDRGFGGAPYTPLFFELWDNDIKVGNIHHSTIKKLIRFQVINSKENESGSGKYSLKCPTSQTT